VDELSRCFDIAVYKNVSERLAAMRARLGLLSSGSRRRFNVDDDDVDDDGDDGDDDDDDDDGDDDFSRLIIFIDANVRAFFDSVTITRLCASSV